MLRNCSALLLLSLLFNCAFSQNIDSLLTIQRKADPQEKVYVHFDKNYYNPGETIWFKAYLFTGIEPSETSKNFYAELLDEGGNVLTQKTAPVIFSGASGSFDLDSNFSKPAIYFRGYTISVLNSDTSFLYTRNIRVLSPKAATPKAASMQPQPSISFLPEGGDLVNGLTSLVSFKAINQHGLPLNISGSIMDQSGTKVTDLKTLHNGMGTFVLTPFQGRTYTASWKDESGKSYTTPLPLAKTQGVGLKITADENKRRFTIYRTQDVPDAQKQLHIIGYMNQHLVFEAKADLISRVTATGVFPTKDLPTGILKITLFDSNYRPLAERITFVNNHDYEFDGDVYFAQKKNHPPWIEHSRSQHF
jgi:hypothetical protein